jgi:broad specificity phosphatase PhoE
VRHGQGSLHGDDYDRLSPVGVAQAKALGELWARNALRLDAVYVGPLERHRQTLEALREAASSAGHALPGAEVLPGADEIRLDGLMSTALGRVLPSCPDLKEQLARGELDEQGREAMRHAMGIAGKLLERWAGGETFDGVEPFEPFTARVSQALQGVMRSQGRGKQVAIITSGGPIAAAVRLALALTPTKMAALMPVIANASVTELRYTESRLTLDVFNAAGHLPAELVTRI